MKLLFLSLLCVSYFLLALSKVTPKRTDKYTMILNSLTQPYSQVLKTFQSKSEQSLQDIQTFIEKSLTGQKITSDENNGYKPKVIKSNQIDNTIDSTQWDSEDGTERSLQQACLSGSKPVNVTVNIYKCAGLEVTKTEYSAGGQDCNVTQTTKSLCYCSYEYYGDSCQTLNPWACQIERLSHPIQCSGTDSFNYVYSYSGVPPCYTVKAGDTVTMRTRAVCQPKNSAYNFEGVKHSKYEVVQQPTISTNFTYLVNNGTLRLTSTPNMVQRLAFTNWNKMSSPVTINTTLSLQQMIGTTYIDTIINFQSPITELATTGRYYYELSLLWSVGSSSYSTINAEYVGGYFEQAGYQEPVATVKKSRALAIVILVLVAVLIVGIIVGYKFYKKRKQEQMNQVVDTALLAAEEPHD